MAEENSSIEKLAEMIKDHQHIVFFGGAGVSTESGIPTRFCRIRQTL